MLTRKGFIFILISIFLLSFSGISVAQSLKERMRKRLPIIVDLKNRGIVGENNKGYLELLPGKKEKPEVIKAENTDREKVYRAIAKKQGTSADVVGKRRALQIEKKAKPKEWIQNANGKWYQKN